MAALLEQVRRHQQQRLAAVALAARRPGKEHVDAGVPVVGVGLLVVLDQPRDLAVPLNDQRGHVVRACELRAQIGLGHLAPALPDLGLGRDLGQPGHVRLLHRPHHQPRAAQDHAVSSAARCSSESSGIRRDSTCDSPSPAMLTPYSTSATSIVRRWCVITMNWALSW